jgi:hypothetical protein
MKVNLRSNKYLHANFNKNNNKFLFIYEQFLMQILIKQLLKINIYDLN